MAGCCSTPLLVCLVVLAVLAARPPPAAALRGVAKTPIMGFSTWNAFRQNINDTLIREIGDALVSTGLADLGYVYVNIDDGWGANDRVGGKIVPHPTKFPHGMRNLSAYLAAKGLKFGLYTARYNRTCGGAMPGSLGHEAVDAQTFADMGATWVKNDDCHVVYANAARDYGAMQAALDAVPTVELLHNVKAPDLSPSEAVAVSQSKRVGKDLHNSWPNLVRVLDTGLDPSMLALTRAGSNFFSDFDMLEVETPAGRVGDPVLTPLEWRAHFSLWAALKSPLQIGCDVRNVSPDALAVLSRKPVIAVSQDALATPVALVRSSPPSHYSNTTKVVLADCAGTPDQQWTVAGSAVRSVDGRCLEVFEGESRFPFVTSVSPCGAAPTQRWTFDNATGRIVSGAGSASCWPARKSQCCLEVEGSNPEADACGWDVLSPARQAWRLNGTRIVSLLTGQCLSLGERTQVFAGPLSPVDGRRRFTAVLFNRGPAAAAQSVTAADLGLPADTTFDVQDLWAPDHQPPPPPSRGGYSATVPSHGVVHVNLTPQP